MNVIKRHWLIIGLVVVAIGILAAFKLKGGEKTEYYTTPADHGDIHELVEATGTINAVTTVQVGSQVSGTIAQLLVDFNSRVKKGQVVAQIDPALFQANLLQAQADAANAKANYNFSRRPGQFGSGRPLGERDAARRWKIGRKGRLRTCQGG